MSAYITRVAYDKGYISSDSVSEFSPEELTQSAGHAPASLVFGGNARESSIRARKLLGWSPSRGSIWDEIPQAVESEAARLNVTKKEP